MEVRPKHCSTEFSHSPGLADSLPPAATTLRLATITPDQRPASAQPLLSWSMVAGDGHSYFRILRAAGRSASPIDPLRDDADPDRRWSGHLPNSASVRSSAADPTPWAGATAAKMRNAQARLADGEWSHPSTTAATGTEPVWLDRVRASCECQAGRHCRQCARSECCLEVAQGTSGQMSHYLVVVAGT
jgi:hypothetical protein